MRISDWSSDVCSSDLAACALPFNWQQNTKPSSSACIRRKSAPSTPLKYPPSPKRCKNWLTNGSRKIASQEKKTFSNRPLPPAYVHKGVPPRATTKKSEEGRVRTEGVSTCKIRCGTVHEKKT